MEDPFAFGGEPAKCARPLGWEDNLPDAGIGDIRALLKYLESRLAKIRVFGERPNGLLLQAVHPDFTERFLLQGREALRNAVRALDHLGVDERPVPWLGDIDGITHHQVEQRLSDLVRWLRGVRERRVLTPAALAEVKSVDERREANGNQDVSGRLENQHQKGQVTGSKRRGRKKADYETVQREAQLAADWKRARESGTDKIKFAKENGMKVKEFDALLDRVAKRKARADK